MATTASTTEPSVLAPELAPEDGPFAETIKNLKREREEIQDGK